MKYRKSLIGEYFAVFLLDSEGNDLNKEPFNVQITEDLDEEALDRQVAIFAARFTGAFASAEEAQAALDQAEHDLQARIAATVERLGSEDVREIPADIYDNLTPEDLGLEEKVAIP